MNKITKITSALALCAVVSSANALQADFIDLADGTLGESAWTTLNFNDGDINLDVTATGFAYLDAGNAGLGDCGQLHDGAVANVANPGSGTNLCNPGSDDNVTVDETLTFTFDTDVDVKFWFNSNHEAAFADGDLITIDGNEYGAITGSFGDGNFLGEFQASAGEAFNISYFNKIFYVSGFAAEASGGPNEVSEPGILALLSVSLLGLGLARRRRA